MIINLSWNECVYCIDEGGRLSSSYQHRYDNSPVSMFTGQAEKRSKK
ncbi:hypothetical protein ACTQ46_01705 [Gallicola sp. Sow4_E12]